MSETDILLDELELIPPSFRTCEECACDHPPQLPHNRNSFYYQLKFWQRNSRFPTWDDAMSHCAEDVKEATVRRLEDAGIIKRVD